MDIIELLDEYGVKYYTGGKNVSVGWIGLRCPFCGDHSNHLGIRMADLKCRCWKCGPHSLVNVLAEVASIGTKHARDISKSLTSDERAILDKQQVGSKPGKLIKYPPEIIDRLPKPHKQYLRSRGFFPNRLKRKYELKACENIGDFKFRIIIPIYQNRLLVSYTSRAIATDMQPKYKNANTHHVLISAKQCIYNIDSVIQGKDCLICEGPIDVWRFGEGAVATIGIQFHQKQLSLLKQKQIRNLFIMLDSERYAQRIKAEQIGRFMAPWVKHFELLEAKWKKDLGDFSQKDAEYLRNKVLKFNK